MGRGGLHGRCLITIRQVVGMAIIIRNKSPKRWLMAERSLIRATIILIMTSTAVYPIHPSCRVDQEVLSGAAQLEKSIAARVAVKGEGGRA